MSVLIIALAAWWGSRWLAEPMGQLVAASRALNDSLGDAAQRIELESDTARARFAKARAFST